jgi:AAA+ superfamily predicted ATPase
LVAIFLRELEYFSGIVFLTTNILRSFDKAIRSRIHLALGFGPPASDIRRLIWISCLEKLPAGEVDLSSIDDALKFLEPQELNGREISNTINTARTIARFQSAKLQLQHIKDVLKVRDAFDKTIRDESRAMKKSVHSDVRVGSLIRQNSILSEEPDEYV